MRTQHFARLIIVAAIACWASSSSAQPTCETTFTGNEDTKWDNDNNWTNDRPTPTKVGCIPPNKTARINQPTVDAEAEAIYIEGDATVIVHPLSTLKIYDTAGDSWIDGDLEVDENAPITLHFVGDVTIVGKGGSIYGGSGYLSESPYNKIIATGTGGGSLTLECDPGGNGSQAECLVVHGAFDIQANLTNNAYVIADVRTVGSWNLGDLVLSGGTKDGSGYWMAADNPNLIPPNPLAKIGRMRVEVPVTGSGTWLLADHVSAEIRFNVACPALTGDVTIHEGFVTLNADFTTTGNFELRSVGGSLARIFLAEGVIATFD